MKTEMNQQETYQAPSIQVIEVETESTILQGSVDSPFYDPGEDF